MFIVALFNFGIYFPFGKISKVPINPIGIMGTLAAKASLTAPVFPFCSFPVKDLVPSGCIPIIFPCFKASIAHFKVSVPLASLSKGIAPAHLCHSDFRRLLKCS